MKHFVTALTLCLAAPLSAQQAETDAETGATSLEVLSAAKVDDLAEFLWVKRPLVVFADRPEDPRFVQQMKLLMDRPGALSERDIVIITDTDPAERSSVRSKLRPHGFSMVLVGKDGSVALRKPSPWHVRELTRSIDKMPLRIEEMRSGL